ncbi:MAG: aldolase/citrate lyase family protein [Chloroflexi bacterium]|nr:aldolase/citrate lyase family protein [Chloroflexota bacterium]MDA1228979.1 aldolase/citrate lyase family protein [Chloroflexota bacterium]
MNAVRDLLKSGKTVVGTSGSVFEDNMAMLADSGLDFILFDTQHAAVEVKQYNRSVQAMRGKKAAPIVRVSANRPDLICFALDIGARGIIVPMVNTKEEAMAMVRACQYSPLGDRSNAGVRGEWGETKDYREYLDTFNEEVLIIPMIETQQAIDNIDEILSVSRIDVLLIGPSDLSIELGVPLDYESDTYQAGLDKIAAACKNHGVVPGMYFIPPQMDPNFFVDKGFKFFTMPWAKWALEGVQNGLGSIKR